MSETVIVAHGLWMPGIETVLLRRRLRSAGFRPVLFRFPTIRGTLTQNAARLADFAARLHADRLHFVGYSLGGVVTLTMLAQSQLANLGRIVCIGAPLAGSRAAVGLAGMGPGRHIVGQSLLEHGRIRGQNDGTVAVEETRIAGAKDHVTLPVSHWQMLFDAGVARQTTHFLQYGRFAR